MPRSSRAEELRPSGRASQDERSDNPAEMSTIPDSGRNAEDALQRLKAGNARFVSGTARFPTMQKEILADLAKGQHPYATILSCSDSRVPPELIFDAGLGELFIIRVAGNVLSPEIGGSRRRDDGPHHA